MSEPVTRGRPEALEPEATRREPIFNLPAVVVLLIVLCVMIHLLRV
jgi:hypothetical protein